MPKVNLFETRILTQKEEPVIRETEELVIQETGSSFAILAGHSPLIAYLQPKAKIVFKTSGHSEEWRLPEGGILQVKDNQVFIFDSANKQ